jgi:tRNA 2-thiouridine synthesizing protein A
MSQTSANDIRVTETLDCSGLLCPLPVYKAGVVLNRLANGEVLELITTDPGALEDIPALARQRGDTLLRTERGDSTQTFWLRKGSAS